MQIQSLLAVACLTAFATSTRAQNINVDIGSVGTQPAQTYGGGAGQVGFWNTASSLILTPQALLDLNLNPIPATLAVSGVFNQFDGVFDNPGTLGDDGLLMDDYHDGGTNPTWTFANLDAGTYSVYTYAWAPDSSTFIDSVTVAGSSDPAQICGGVWPGAQTLGITYTKHTLTVPAGGSIAISFTIVATYTTVNGFQIHKEGTPFTLECPGDTAALCPCSGAGGSNIPNPGATGNGCANSSFPAGAALAASGNAVDNPADTLVLTCSNMTGPGLFIQANATLGPIINFNDGTLCAASGIIRMGVVFPTAGVASYPGGLTPAPIHTAGAPVMSPTPTKHYQCWYRDITVGFCNTLGHNMSNGVSLVWAP